MKQISSTQNALIKQITQLQEKSRNRKKEGLFVLEGMRELLIANESQYTIDTILFYPEYCDEHTLRKSINQENIHWIEISKEVFQKIAYRGSTEGVVALIKSKNHTVKNLSFKNNTPLVLVAEAPEKPGNIGALLRTADAANIDAVLIANPKTDLYNPNIIRSSVGCIFSQQIAMASTEEILSFLNEKQINIYAATLQNSNAYHLEDYTESTALVVGTEDTGLSQQWRDAAKQNIIIPMQGKIDSMNVSVAAGILIFEAKRQRQFQ